MSSDLNSGAGFEASDPASHPFDLQVAEAQLASAYCSGAEFQAAYADLAQPMVATAHEDIGFRPLEHSESPSSLDTHTATESYNLGEEILVPPPPSAVSDNYLAQKLAQLGVYKTEKGVEPEPHQQRRQRRERPRSHTPRPSNSFIIYRREKHAEIMANFHGAKNLNNNVISKIVAGLWREERPDVRAYYAARAEQEKREHMIKYPDYKYRPRKNGGAKGFAAASAAASAAGSGGGYPRTTPPRGRAAREAAATPALTDPSDFDGTGVGSSPLYQDDLDDTRWHVLPCSVPAVALGHREQHASARSEQQQQPPLDGTAWYHDGPEARCGADDVEQSHHLYAYDDGLHQHHHHHYHPQPIALAAAAYDHLPTTGGGYGGGAPEDAYGAHDAVVGYGTGAPDSPNWAHHSHATAAAAYYDDDTTQPSPPPVAAAAAAAHPPVLPSLSSLLHSSFAPRMTPGSLPPPTPAAATSSHCDLAPPAAHYDHQYHHYHYDDHHQHPHHLHSHQDHHHYGQESSQPFAHHDYPLQPPDQTSAGFASGSIMRSKNEPPSLELATTCTASIAKPAYEQAVSSSPSLAASTAAPGAAPSPTSAATYSCGVGGEADGDGDGDDGSAPAEEPWACLGDGNDDDDHGRTQLWLDPAGHIAALGRLGAE
ncbi:hypothetical protein HK405_009700 [Cladochytrium tenue]|nr:hypothetical protein HK405_009700 [Cladochytrium tenue]